MRHIGSNDHPALDATDDDLGALLAEFPEEQRELVRAELGRYGERDYHREVARVRRDVLRLARGDLEAVRRLMDAAVVDYRDVLYWAEYRDDDPWWLWNRLLSALVETGLVQADDRDRLDQGGGFLREPSLVALERLVGYLKEREAPLSHDVYEQLRAYGKRWKSRAIWRQLRRSPAK
ncbi:MAG: hypothetical protein JW940_03240 [Polyangiaceae bacterium]|nr:hypothetical protein [Polyangiaceae bacterium]